MNLLFLLPDIQDVPTGGNIYNTRMVQALRPHCNVQQVVYSAAQSDAGAAMWAGTYDWVLVDSLLVDHLPVQQEIQRIRRQDDSNTQWALLVHYLPFFDPGHAAVAKPDLEALRIYDLFVTTSKYSQTCLIQAGLDPERIVVAYPGLDAAHRVPRPPHNTASPVKLLTVSSLLPGKGLRPFMDVLDQLPLQQPWRWQLVGDDTLDKAHAMVLFDRIIASPAADRIDWQGPLAPTAMPACYREADVFVLPSLFETLGMAVREAMAAGTPVVAFDVGGVHESLSDGAGELVAPFQYDVLTEVLASLLTNQQARVALGQRGLARSQQFPSWDVSSQTLLHRLLGKEAI